MKLEEYLFFKKISKKQFAEDIEVSRNYIHDLIAGRRSPSPKLAKKIEEATGGQVTKEELLFPEDFE